VRTGLTLNIWANDDIDLDPDAFPVMVCSFREGGFPRVC